MLCCPFDFSKGTKWLPRCKKCRYDLKQKPEKRRIMRLFSRFRMMRKWKIIFTLAAVFVIGNLLLLRNWSHSGNSDAADGNTRPIEKGPALSSEIGMTENKERDVLGSNIIPEDSKDLSPVVTEKKIENEPTNKPEKRVVFNEKQPQPSKAPQQIIDLKPHKEFKYKIAILVIACNRPSVSRCLDNIFKVKPKGIDMPVLVSQDCGHAETENVIKSYGEKLTLVKQPDLSDVKGVPDNMRHFMGYYKISRHYKFALTQAFKDPKIDSVVIVEDDLNIAPDFFEYFMATRPLLDMDNSLFCISAWNDNGKEGYVKDNKLLYRTDFFPGLGWMLSRGLWKELGPKWPLGFWDDWMRNPNQRKNRACIRPEISRSKTFGRIGVSQGQFYDQYLKFIQLNDQFYPFMKADLSYLLKSNYDKEFLQRVNKVPIVHIDDAMTDNFRGEAARILYSSNNEIESHARQFGLMTDLKAGVPRTAYKGIVSFVRHGKQIYLVPMPGWNGYTEN